MSLIRDRKQLGNAPYFAIKIDTQAFPHPAHVPPMLARLRARYLPQYWGKLGFNQKTISASCEDRLCELTTRQIDRIIDMERIKSTLNDKKAKVGEVKFYFDPKATPNQHSHIYQANFLAKINRIAIQRNIKKEKSEGFDDNFIQRQRRDAYNVTRTKKTQMEAYKYTKSDVKREDLQSLDETKSIASIADDLEEFEAKVEKAMRIEREMKSQIKTQTETNIQGFNEAVSQKLPAHHRLSTNHQSSAHSHLHSHLHGSTLRGKTESHMIKWFEGMSMHYLKRSEMNEQVVELQRGMDMECDGSKQTRFHVSRLKTCF